MSISVRIKKIENRIKSFQEKNLIKNRFSISHREKNKIIFNHQLLINFSSNDYLGLSEHPAVKKAFIAGIEQYGTGSGSSATLSGYLKPHRDLEENVADFLKRDRAILFNSGYHANLGALTTFANRNTIILSDKLCHASLLDGIQLSKAKHIRFAHRDAEKAESLNEQHRSAILVTESVFSMEGDIAPIDRLAAIAKKNQSLFLVDDAHGIGILGKTGRGAIEHFNLKQQDLPILITPLGKAMGSLGAIVSGENSVIDALSQFSKTYRYTTALPPAISCATLAALNILKQETWRREKLQKLIQFFIIQAKLRSLPLISDDLTPIKSILIGNNAVILKLEKILLDHGLFVSCIRPPTVPNNTARIRISLNCFHAEDDIINLLDKLAIYY